MPGDADEDDDDEDDDDEATPAPNQGQVRNVRFSPEEFERVSQSI